MGFVLRLLLWANGLRRGDVGADDVESLMLAGAVDASGRQLRSGRSGRQSPKCRPGQISLDHLTLLAQQLCSEQLFRGLGVQIAHTANSGDPASKRVFRTAVRVTFGIDLCFGDGRIFHGSASN